VWAVVAVVALSALLTSVITWSLVRAAPEQGAETTLRTQALAITGGARQDRLGGRLGVLAQRAELCRTTVLLRLAGTELYLLGRGGAPLSPPQGCPLAQRLPARLRQPLAPPPDVDLAGALAADGPLVGTSGRLAYAAAAVGDPAGQVAGVLLVRRTRALPGAVLGLVGRRLLAATALALAVAAVVAWLLAGRLVEPLGRLVAAARRLGSGDLATRVAVDGDDEVAEVGAAFNDMAAALGRLQAEQRAFLASVGHELKTPLTTVQGYTEALLDGAVEDPAEQRRSLELVHAETLRLGRLVQDLLDLARLGRGQFAVQPVDADVTAVLREAAAAAAERAGGRGVPVVEQLPGPLAGHVDPGRLRQVLDNLLDNAIRSSPPGSAVVVAARPLAGGLVEAAVVDRGPGIAAEDLPHAFDRGYLWSRYRGTRTVGSGLGLAIVKALCDAMGVQVTAEQVAGGGTAFRLVVPGPRGPHPDGTLARGRLPSSPASR
jgi:two-component system sensor histidine kinase BaeS